VREFESLGNFTSAHDGLASARDFKEALKSRVPRNEAAIDGQDI
jgi:hypothetical protein